MISLPIIRRLLSPLIVSLFAIGWYEFSVQYIVPNNNVALENGVFSAYISPSQLQGYIEATRYICYIVVYLGLIFFWYNLVKTVRELEGRINNE
ncbi:hypothetical protein GFS03_12270 [Sulfolobus sp. E5-1-F]|nr:MULTISPECIES: hypothetical protein [unclassified Sulfolobus]QGA55543.1 hypothetical protein GFS03_12270 [Sulfolobus sp. E5-1-F]QGA68080.1 hypothetical protein GFS33_04105 [Sulfolobus sp. E11-6]